MTITTVLKRTLPVFILGLALSSCSISALAITTPFPTFFVPPTHPVWTTATASLQPDPPTATLIPPTLTPTVTLSPTPTETPLPTSDVPPVDGGIVPPPSPSPAP